MSNYIKSNKETQGNSSNFQKSLPLSNRYIFLDTIKRKKNFPYGIIHNHDFSQYGQLSKHMSVYFAQLRHAHYQKNII